MNTQRRTLITGQDGSRLGVWAAEGFQNERSIFDLSESPRSAFLEGTRGSRTPGIETFYGAGLLAPTLLAEFLLEKGYFLHGIKRVRLRLIHN